MAEFIKITISLIIMASIAWFISFQLNPKSLCKDHSDPSMKKDYYECIPGGFALEKGTILEQDPDHHFLWDQDIKFVKDYKNKKEKIIKRPSKEFWECKDEFYLLTDEQMVNVNINDYCIYKGKNQKGGIKEKTVPSMIPQQDL